MWNQQSLFLIFFSSLFFRLFWKLRLIVSKLRLLNVIHLCLFQSSCWCVCDQLSAARPTSAASPIPTTASCTLSASGVDCSCESAPWRTLRVDVFISIPMAMACATGLETSAAGQRRTRTPTSYASTAGNDVGIFCLLASQGCYNRTADSSLLCPLWSVRDMIFCLHSCFERFGLILF